MNVDDFINSLYKDRELQYEYLDLISREEYQGIDLDLALRLRLGRDYQDLEDRDKLSLKHSLRRMYNNCVAT